MILVLHKMISEEFTGVTCYGSSGVNWCEPDFQYSEWVHELYNTVSNIPYILFAMVHWYCQREYIKNFDSNFKYMEILLLITGLGSIYFHATLSTLGQLADELTILWMFALTGAWYYPLQVFKPRSELEAQKYRRSITKLSISLAIGCTAMSRNFPQMNSFVLVILAQFYILAVIVAFCEDQKTPLYKKLFGGFIGFGLAAICCWTLDMVACQWFQKFGVPIFHSLWHILSAYLVCYVFNICVYHKMSNFSGIESKNVLGLRFKPNIPVFGVPYVEIDTSPQGLERFRDSMAKKIQFSQSSSRPENHSIIHPSESVPAASRRSLNLDNWRFLSQ